MHSGVGRGIFSISKHGRPVEWVAVAAELQRGRDSQVNFGPNALQTCLTCLGVRGIPDAGAHIPSMPTWQSTDNLELAA